MASVIHVLATVHYYSHCDWLLQLRFRPITRNLSKSLAMMWRCGYPTNDANLDLTLLYIWQLAMTLIWVFRGDFKILISLAHQNLSSCKTNTSTHLRKTLT